MKTHTDEQLVNAYLKGDEESLEILIKQYLKPLYSFVYRYVRDSQETEDIIQEVFIKTWQNLKRFDQQKSFKAWIFVIAKNTAIDFLKKKKAVPFSMIKNFENENIIQGIFGSEPKLNELFEQKTMIEIVSVALEKISLKYRQVLSLYYNNGLTLQEIAGTLKEPVNTIKTRHRRGIQLLKKSLETK